MDRAARRRSGKATSLTASLLRVRALYHSRNCLSCHLGGGHISEPVSEGELRGSATGQDFCLSAANPPSDARIG